MIEKQISQAIENRFSVVYFISRITMLVVVDYCVGAGIYKKTISFFHAGRWQRVMFVSSMHDDQNIIGFCPCLLYIVGIVI